ncbi:MAG: chemotaxis protein CheW [Humidesulfovibrio sp.]|uniref:chemotaxis protein CheW n=1 Tax=Humidesulfovibrio sp. TaxID=2910988 RepID=UPI0027E97F4E|nr:chemotaxis protein CheW [Humidesulfovibrio sp.]MDQ7836592.1 chemotaxis protein CheW [Humidesulfovibrio sp.]
MAEKSASDTSQYLNFTLGKEVFAVDIASVREVLELTAITKIPRTPDYMCGVINLRGHAVPVMDMRLKFGMPQTETTVDTCIIIVEVDFEGESIIMGGKVDSVREVFDLTAEHIEAAPRMGTSINTDYIKGIGKQDETFVIILDIAKVFSAEELALAKEAQKEAA